MWSVGVRLCAGDVFFLFFSSFLTKGKAYVTGLVDMVQVSYIYIWCLCT